MLDAAAKPFDNTRPNKSIFYPALSNALSRHCNPMFLNVEHSYPEKSRAGAL